MTARDRFHVNQRVKLSEKGRAQLGTGYQPGIVRGFGRKPELVRIQRDGVKSVESYHMDFWEPIE